MIVFIILIFNVKFVIIITLFISYHTIDPLVPNAHPLRQKQLLLTPPHQTYYLLLQIFYEKVAQGKGPHYSLQYRSVVQTEA